MKHVEQRDRLRTLRPAKLAGPHSLVRALTAKGESREVELKLTGDPTLLLDTFGELNGGETRTQKVLSTYYDTDDRRLWRRGFTLRLRQKADGYELTLKQENGDGLKRREWTSPVEGPTADIGRLPADAPRDKLGAILPEELKPRFSSDIERARREFNAGDSLIEVSLDRGRIVAADCETPVAEIEFELLEGPVAGMLEGVRALLEQRRLAVSTRSKAARGMDLVTRAPPGSVRAAKPDLAASESVDGAVAKIVAVATAQILGNLAAAADGRDPEGVHQLRVALRRLRSAVTLFKGHLAPRSRALNDEAHSALRLLGPARDLDVFLSQTMPPVLRGNPDSPGLRHLVKVAEDRRREAYGEVRRLVADRHFNRFLIDLLIIAESGGLVARDRDELLGPTARALLQRRHQEALDLGKNFEQLTLEQRHQVRIALKKLRYACDFFQTLYPPKATRAYLRRLAALQDDLGRLNDVAVADELLDRLAAGHDEAQIAAALIKGWYRHGLQTVEPHMLCSWRQFTEARAFWRG